MTFFCIYAWEGMSDVLCMEGGQSWYEDERVGQSWYENERAGQSWYEDERAELVPMC